MNCPNSGLRSGALSAELTLALQGAAENGWSNAEIVDTVGSLCGDTGPIEWTVQP